ncbi:unnamed protein product [Cylicocyclus nassatus]|uniref:Major facilitator superfamily (MFS) profile domain-containing protein n=1 Tax=Cylicocyclus nassatus TaxID=53992 RepID=A0AA36M8A6_CYLNA|nr:unnamed protein product [Cylicocyclus nassatus]
MSIYFMSTWQYLSEVDHTASMDFFGWIVAAGSLGCAIANPLFGHWSQLTGSTKTPVCFGFSVSAIGNLIYALLPILPSYIKWAMLISRFGTGFGAGTLGVLRSFVATASTRKNRVRAVSLGTAGFTTGLSVGPAFQICFIPLGSTGFSIGPLIFNMYTSAAYFMFIVSILSVFLVQIYFVEDYAGIISDEEKKQDPFLVIPKFDRLAVIYLFYVWWMLCGVASTEGLASPITIAMYNWTYKEAILYNGILQVIACGTSTATYALIASTRIGTWDRRLVLAMGLSGFFFTHLCHYPMPFYEGPLSRPKMVNGTVASDAGGCSYEYDWCEHTPRVPIWLYLFNFGIVQGVSFPFISAPANTLLSEIVGPRKQGTIQGFFAFTGSMAQFVVPLFSTTLFADSGYKYIMVYHLFIILFAAVMAFILRRRLVPLELTPAVGIATKFKRGTFYRM